MKAFFRFVSLPFLMLAIFSSQSSSATANTLSARKQIHSAVQQQAAAVIQQEAKRHQWPDYQAKMNLFIPSEVAQFSPCGKALSVSHPDAGRLDLNRLRFEVRCAEEQGWEVAVIVKPDIYLPVVIARSGIERGHVISPADVTVRKFNISSSRGNYVTNPDDVVGLTVKRRIRERQPVAMSQLESPVLVERGQRVTMVAGQDGVEASTVGEAMKKGRKGETIKVKNASSNRIVSAVITGSGTVRMTDVPGQ